MFQYPTPTADGVFIFVSVSVLWCTWVSYFTHAHFKIGNISGKDLNFCHLTWTHILPMLVYFEQFRNAFKRLPIPPPRMCQVGNSNPTHGSFTENSVSDRILILDMSATFIIDTQQLWSTFLARLRLSVFASLIWATVHYFMHPEGIEPSLIKWKGF